MFPGSPFSMVILVALAVAACTWGAVLVPWLVEQARLGTAVLPLAGLYLIGLAPAASSLAASWVGAEHLAVALVNLSATAVAAILVVAAFLGAGTAAPHLAQGRLPGIVRWSLVGYGLLLLVSGFLHGYVTLPILLTPGLVFVVTSEGISMALLVRHLRYIVRAVMAASLVLLLLGGPSAFFVDNGRTFLGYDQLQGVAPHPNVLGPIAAFALAVELAPGQGRRSFVGVAAAVSVCLFAQSRAGLVAAGCVFVIWLLGRFRWFPGVIIWSLIGMVFAPFLALTFLHGLAGTLLQIAELNSRGRIWEFAWASLVREPILGGGPEVFSLESRLASGDAFLLLAGQAHNQALQTAAQVGVIGIGFLVAFVVSLSKSATRASVRGELLPAMSLVVLLVHSLSEAPLRNVFTLQLFLLVAVAAIAIGSANRYGWQLNPLSEKRRVSRA